MVFNIEADERNILMEIGKVADKMQYPTFVVGGYVRDRILGRANKKDIDVVCVGSGIKLAEQVAEQLHPKPRLVVYRRFGTAMFRHKGMEIEFVGARKESYRKDSRKPAVEEGTLEDDQYRRDFTINTLAVSLNERNFGTLIDPFEGMSHLEEKKIITPLNPDKTFSDDPLRMMRAIRFASQLPGFFIEEKTLEAISRNATRIRIVSKERITIELEKILATPKPSIGFKLLFDTGLLELVFPEMEALHGVEFKNGKGHKDNFYHTLEVVDNLCLKTTNIWLRWSAVMHDIAKPPTKRFNPEVGWTFHGHEALGASMVPKIFKRMRLPLDGKMKYVQKLVRLHLRPISLTKENITDAAVRRLIFEAGSDIDDLMLLCEADITSKNPTKVKRYLENYEIVRERIQEVEKGDELRNWQPPISGELIMETFGIKPSKEVGDIKNAIREAILDGDIANNYEEAYAFMLSKGEEIGLVRV